MPIVPAFYPIPTGWHIGGVDYDIEPPDSPQLDGPLPCAQMAVRTPVFPVAAMPRPVPGWKLGCFFDDYYFRIHVVPTRIDLGDKIINEVTAEVLIWNADLTPRTAAGVSGLADGMEIAAPNDAPAPWRSEALEEQTWTLKVHPDGEVNINAYIRWAFDIPSPALYVTGNRFRLPPWLLFPNWKDPVTERLSWLTDVLASTSGAEQRRALRQIPRRRLEAAFLAEGEERRRLDVMLAALGSDTWALPIWPDMQYLKQKVPVDSLFIPCITAHRDFAVGEIVILAGLDSYEMAVVASIHPTGLELEYELTQSHPVGTRLYPIRPARFSRQPELTRHTDRLYEFSAAFDVLEGQVFPQEPTPLQYRKCSVYLERPNESEDLSDSYQRIINMLDVQVGKTRAVDVAKRGFPVRSHRWINGDLSALARLKSLLFMLRGRQAAVWLPTHMDDMTAVRTTTVDYLWIRAFGYSRYGVGKLGRQDIAIWLRSGEVLLRRITEAIVDPADANVERLKLEPPLSRQYQPDEFVRISYLALMRLADDDVEIEHLTGDNGISRISLTFRAVRDDLEAV